MKCGRGQSHLVLFPLENVVGKSIEIVKGALSSIFLPLGFQEDLLARSFPLSWRDLCHRAKYPTVLCLPSWLLFSASLPGFCFQKPQHGELGIGERVAFSSTADYEKFQTYGQIERILQ